MHGPHLKPASAGADTPGVKPRPDCCPPWRARVRGVSAIELLTVIVLVCILTAAAAPSFRDLVRANRTSSEVTQLGTDLMFARSEAIRRGTPVSLCISTNGSSCAPSGTRWDAGWIIFADANADQRVDSEDSVLRVQAAFGTGGDTFTDTSTRAFSYDRSGFAQAPGSTVLLVLNAVPADSFSRRCLAVNRVGQMRVLQAGQSVFGQSCP